MPKSNSKKPKKNAKNHFKKESIDLAKAETLESIKPRDVFGGSTGKRFEYQYEQSAKACLELLEEDEICCVFCEWHDDFVVEKSAPSSKAKVLYVFNQVKTREGAQGPWDIYNVFGINKIKITQPNKITSSFAYKLFRHFVDFGSSCDSLVFLTNAAIDKDFENFYLQVQSTETWNKLDTKRKELFELLFKNYEKVFDSLNKDQFFDMLKRFQVVAEEIPLGQSKTAFQSNLTEKIHRLSEIDLLHTEATQIVKNLLDLVRTKSHYEVKGLISNGNLKRVKGVQIDEVLNLLSLSASGYDALKQGESQDILKQLSRLQRILKDSDPKLTDTKIREFCEIKVKWENWKRKLRHKESALADLGALRESANHVLNQWTDGSLSIQDVISEAGNLATQYKNALTGPTELNSTLVFGLILTLAVED